MQLMFQNNERLGSRLVELDSLYTEMMMLSGLTAEQLVELLRAGYTIEPPNYEASLSALSDAADEPLTLEQLQRMDGQPVWLEFMQPIEYGWSDQWFLIDADEGVAYNSSYRFPLESCCGMAYAKPTLHLHIGSDDRAKKQGNLNYFRIFKPKEVVDVILVKHKGTEEYSFVNLTKGHICPCRFKSFGEALADIEKRVKDGKILNYLLLKREN